jgi:hypothetical protein
MPAPASVKKEYDFLPPFPTMHDQS